MYSKARLPFMRWMRAHERQMKEEAEIGLNRAYRNREEIHTITRYPNERTLRPMFGMGTRRKQITYYVEEKDHRYKMVSTKDIPLEPMPSKDELEKAYQENNDVHVIQEKENGHWLVPVSEVLSKAEAEC